MRKRKQPCRHYRLSIEKMMRWERENEARVWRYDRRLRDCFNCVHYKSNFMDSICARSNTPTIPEYCCCPHFRGNFAKTKRERN